MTEVELPNPDELAERAEKTFGRRVALVTAIYAVALAIAALGGNNATKEMLLAQQQASDQWSFYQAKVQREHLYRVQRLQVELALAEPTGPGGAARKRYEELAARLAEEERRYNTEKKDLERDAKRLEAVRDRNQARDPYFDWAEALLQIAVVCSSVAIIATSRPMFWFSLVLATAGLVLTLNGFLLLFRLPFFHGAH